MKILITGATSGIGYEVAKRLSLKGHDVLITAHTVRQLNEFNKKTNYKIKSIKLDVTNKLDREKLDNINIDCLINNVGIGEGGSISEINMSKVRKNFEVNVFSNFEIVQHFLKKMLIKNNGTIIIMSSLLGIMPMKFLGVYSATKASIISLTTSLRQELKMLNKNIKIKLIEPGAYYTGFNQVMLNNKYKWMENESYFKRYITKIQKQENKTFNLIEQKQLDNIVNKIIEAVESNNNKFIYRAPKLQVIATKLYNLLFM